MASASPSFARGVNGPNAPAGDGLGLGGGVVVDVGGGEDRIGRGSGDRPCRAAVGISRLPAAWCRCGIVFTRNLLVVSVMGSW